jgi:hypothetical protein
LSTSCVRIIIWQVWQVGRLIQPGDVLIVIGAVLSAFGVAGFGFVLAYTYYRGEIPKDAARVFLLSFVFGFGLWYSVLLIRSLPKRLPETASKSAAFASRTRATSPKSHLFLPSSQRGLGQCVATHDPRGVRDVAPGVVTFYPIHDFALPSR